MFRNRYAILLGISEYEKFSTLKAVRGDIHGTDNSIGLASLLKSGIPYSSFTVYPYCQPFTAPQAKKIINDHISDISENFNSEDTLLLIYFSGHGVKDPTEDEENAFLLATTETDPEKPSTGLSVPWLLRSLSNTKVSVAVVLDCCYSGQATLAVKQLGSKQNYAIFCSSSNNERSSSTLDQEQGEFTRLFIDVLCGKEPLAMSCREVTSHSLHTFFKHHASIDGQVPHSVVGKNDFLLIRPHSTLISRGQLGLYQGGEFPQAYTDVFNEYLTGILNEFKDHDDIINDELFVYSESLCFCAKGTPLEKDPDVPAFNDTLASLKNWLTNPDPLLMLLGDTGTGKTHTLKRFWHDIASDHMAGKNNSIPIYIDLRLYAGVRLRHAEVSQADISSQSTAIIENNIQRHFRAVLHDNLQNREGLSIPWHDFVSLVKQGKILLIFDGLDEIDCEGTATSLAEHLSLFKQFISSDSKMIISCRKQYIRSDRELIEGLSTLSPFCPNFPILEIKPFDYERIQRFVKARLPEDVQKAFSRLRQPDKDVLGLLELCSRPFLLDSVCQHLQEVGIVDQLSPDAVFSLYLKTWLGRDSWRFMRFYHDFSDVLKIETRIEQEDKANVQDNNKILNEEDIWSAQADTVVTGFVEHLAAYLWTHHQDSIQASKLPTLLRAELPDVPDILIAFCDYAIRTCTFLTRTRDDYYSFLHPSVL